MFKIRLHREALKQSATDPLSGKIDVGILTTGLSTAERKKRADLVVKIKETLKKKGKVPTVSYPKLYTEIRENSQIVSIWQAYIYLVFGNEKKIHKIIFFVNRKVMFLVIHKNAFKDSTRNPNINGCNHKTPNSTRSKL